METSYESTDESDTSPESKGGEGIEAGSGLGEGVGEE
jgi:hypothetical protein